MNNAVYTAAGVALLAFAVFALFSWGAPIAFISAAAGLLLVVFGQAAPRKAARESVKVTAG